MPKIMDTLPTCTNYSNFLDRAMNTFNISRNEARNKYGSFTNKQWDDLLSNTVEVYFIDERYDVYLNGHLVKSTTLYSKLDKWAKVFGFEITTIHGLD